MFYPVNFENSKAISFLCPCRPTSTTKIRLLSLRRKVPSPSPFRFRLIWLPATKSVELPPEFPPLNLSSDDQSHLRPTGFLKKVYGTRTAPAGNELSRSGSRPEPGFLQEGPHQRQARPYTGRGVRDFPDQHRRQLLPPPRQHPRNPQGYPRAPREAVSPRSVGFSFSRSWNSWIYRPCLARLSNDFFFFCIKMLQFAAKYLLYKLLSFSITRPLTVFCSNHSLQSLYWW